MLRKQNIFQYLLLFFAFFIVFSSNISAENTVDSFDIRLRIEQKLGEAIKNGNEEKVINYLKNNDVNRRLLGGSTLLLEAIYFRQKGLVNILLKRGADPNLRSGPFNDVNDDPILQDSPLEAAMMFDTSFIIAGMLLKHGADINSQAQYFGTALHRSIYAEGNEKPDGFYGEDAYQSAPEASEKLSMKKVLWLIKKGADVNAKNIYGDTPLLKAINMKYYKVADYLIEKNADVKLMDNNGETLLFRIESPELAKKLINKGVDVNATGGDGLTALYFAVSAGKIEVAKILINNGAELNTRDSDSHLTPLEWLIVDWYGSSYDMAKLLISKGAVYSNELVKQYGLEEIFKQIKEELCK